MHRALGMLNLVSPRSQQINLLHGMCAIIAEGDEKRMSLLCRRDKVGSDCGGMDIST